MRLGVLDVGSNTVHLLIVDARQGAMPIPQQSHKLSLRLMRYLDGAAITDEGVERLVAAISECVEIAKASELDELMVMATSAVREAENGKSVIARIEAAAGIELQILSGVDEAKLTFLAVRRWIGWSAGRILLFDIGGGSLEIAAGDDEVPSFASSVPLGAGRSTAAFLHEDPPTAAQQQALRSYARAVLADVVADAKAVGRPDHVVGSSKTIRSLAKLAGERSAGVGGNERLVLHRDRLDEWVKRLARMDARSRAALPGITEDRTVQIVGGAIVLSEAMRAFGVHALEISPWALREGRILRYLDAL